jgi:hypothetical protein
MTALTVFCLSSALHAQSQVTAPYELAGQFSYLTNSFNGLPGSQQPLPGWDASMAFPAWRGIRFKLDLSSYRGNNLGATQKGVFYMGGFQYEHSLLKERVFAQALFGDVGLNRYWGPNAQHGDTASFAEELGGGLDTPISRHLALRFEGDMMHTNLALLTDDIHRSPYHLAGLPNYYGRFSTGLVWTPRLRPAEDPDRSSEQNDVRVPNELIAESLNSFGHWHVFGITWWSYLNVAGIEYDRHTWGHFLGARSDYVAEFLPVVILRQPVHTDIWGNPRWGNTTSRNFTTVPGVGLSPIGTRLMWRDGKAWKPYYTIKLGMMVFTQKVLSQYASYEVFSMQQAVGLQFRVTDQWDFRTGVSDFHFSNAFVVPSNPGIDEMAYNFGLSYHFTTRPFRF